MGLNYGKVWNRFFVKKVFKIEVNILGNFSLIFRISFACPFYGSFKIDTFKLIKFVRLELHLEALIFQARLV